ncbi:flocculation protein FLO11-like [Macadamia integrifolia]|uniref:flocculation protein FLO11-like n=1 Tax=Macadamia integrifolia TaxID=60698 RepID=UPI001C4E4CE8|nr:flocculation protein FLO11-like [Macadamia integrifolia]XP_042514239.1 flocculation protein FLO11-like [Macadamia integrifolia]
MVQRKDPDKLGILADSKNNIKSEKWSLALKPSPQNQDVQDKGETELKKKKLKKSRSIKLLDLENLEPLPTRRPKSRFHKLPANASSAAVTPQAPLVIKMRDPSPNYMKPTSSSHAKKERSQVSPLSYQASSPRKSLSPNPNGRNSSRMSLSPAPSGRNANSLSLSPSGRNSSRMSLSPAPSGRNANSLSLSPSGRNSSRMSLSPAPSGRNANSLSPSPSGRNPSRMSLGPVPSGRNSYHNSLSPCPSGRNSNRMSLSPSPTGRNSHGNSLSHSPSRRNSYRPSLSPTPSGRNSHCSPSPIPSGRNSPGINPSPSLNRRNSDHSKPCSASAHKPIKTSTKTSSLKPVRTLTKTPSFKGGAELKKQIKKSGSIKLLDLESLESSPTEQTKMAFVVSTTNVSSAAISPQKQFLMKTPYLLPNYMKPTSSSDARKEYLPFSTQGSQTNCPSKSPNESNLIHIKHSSASVHKPARTLTKTFSLKPVRTLTKTSSLKLPRPSIRQSPDTAQCSSLKAGRATCSSTLKDSKFPAFLTLNPGATESEGTSTMKVCPYTYCSLNGHHHTPLPLLKHFISARRQVLKTQKSLRLKNLSSLEKTTAEEGKKKTELDQMAFNEHPMAQVDLPPSTISHVIKEDVIDFFVEIYAKPREDTATPIGRSIQDGDDVATILGSIAYSVIHGTKNDTGKVHESMPDVDWEIVAPPTDTESDLMTVYLPESKSPRLQEELVFEPDDIVNNSEEFPAGHGQEQVHTENAESFSMEYGGDDSETDTDDQSLWPGVATNVGDEGTDISNLPDENFLSSTEVAFEEPATTMEERDGSPKPDNTFNSMAHSASVEDPTASIDEKDEEPQPENFLQEHPKPISITDEVNDTLENKQESSSVAHTSNLVGTGIGGDEEKKQAEDSVENDEHREESSHAENSIGEEEMMQVEDNMESDATETIHGEDIITNSKEDNTIAGKGNNSNQQLPMTSNLKRVMRRRRPIEDQEEPREFNPREPQYLDIEPEPEPEPEKVDLRHQMMDERKNAEEWMLDHAIQQAVTKLAPARKRRVALLVEAFEAVIPPPKCETRLPNTSAAFAHARRIQACN